MQKLTTSMKSSLPGAVLANYTLYPGAILDPDHIALGGASEKVWLGSGWIRRIVVTTPPQTGNAVIVTIVQARDAEGRPVASGTAPFERYVIDDAAAVAEKPTLGVEDNSFAGGFIWTPGDLVSDVFGGPKPASINSAWLSWEGVAYRDDGTAGELMTYEWNPDVYCGVGMVVRALSTAALAGPGALAVTYEPDISGATRYQAARRPQNGFVPA